jgi:group I intron endonuclease
MIIYRVTNIINGKVYIGQTVKTLEMRKSLHLSNLKKGSDLYFHRAIKKYGEENFKWEILCELDSKEKLDEMEKFLISIYKKEKCGCYNMTDGGDGATGYKHTEENKKKISESNKGRINPYKGRKRKPLSDETKKKLSEAHKGKIISEETRKKISTANKGKKRSEESKKRISIGKKGIPKSKETKKKLSDANKGKKHTEESKQKMSKGHMGNIPWNKGKKECFSDEVKKKLSDSHRGFKHTEESKKKISESHKGKKFSDETKKKISDARKKYRKNKNLDKGIE